MALVISGTTVATGMSPVVEGALYADEIFQDGVTFTSEHDVNGAGQIQINVYNPDTTLTAVLPGSDFEHTAFTNGVLELNCNNAFHKSQKVPAFLSAEMPPEVIAAKTWSVTEDVRVARQKTALAILAGTGSAATSTETITADNVKEEAIKARKELVTNFAKPDVVIASVNTYAAMLERAGKDYTPMANDAVSETGRVGMWLGMLWIEAPLLAGQLGFINTSGNASQFDASKVDFVMYDHRAYTIVDKLTLLRTIDNPNAAGSLVQEEIVSGFKVTNNKCVLVKKTV